MAPFDGNFGTATSGALQVPTFNEQSLLLSEKDLRTLYFIGGYTLGIFVLWNFPVLKHLLYPFKLVVTVLHEFGHAIVGKCTGAKINAIKINDDTSGVTEMRGGNQYLTLPAGYLGTSFLGGLMVFAGFDILASKVVAVLIALTFLLTLYWARNWIARVLPVLCTALLAVLWWYKEGMYLPYAVLFLGVMCALQSLWDFQGLVMYKHPDSDATKFAELCMCCPGQVWGFIWLMIALVFMCGWAMLGVVVF